LGASWRGHLEFSQLESPEKGRQKQPKQLFFVVVVVVHLDVFWGGLPVYIVKIIAN
jgi:hypothetical protein